MTFIRKLPANLFFKVRTLHLRLGMAHARKQTQTIQAMRPEGRMRLPFCVLMIFHGV